MAVFVSAIPAIARTQREFSFQHDYILGTSLELTLTGATSNEAQAAEDAALRTIDRLSAILNTRDPNSEISLRGKQSRSPELQSVLNAYRYWEQRTNGVIRCELNGNLVSTRSERPILSTEPLKPLVLPRRMPTL